MGHTYFTDEGEAAVAAVASASGAPPTTAAATRAAACCSRARVSFNDADPTYVFKAAASPDGSGVAASLSNGSIKLYSAAAAQLVHAGDIPAAHTATITDIQFALPGVPHALYSCSRDGSVKAWDVRTRQLAESFKAGNEQLFSFAVAEHLVAGGGSGNVLFWDRRTQKQLAVFDDMHMDDVTQVLFHTGSGKLISGSEDGLIAVHDVGGGLNQDDGFVAALNAGTSVQQLGLYGPAGHTLWCTTGTETLQLWDWLAATDESVQGGDVAVADLTDARQLAAAAASSSGTVAAALQQVDYLVCCHFDAASQQLLLVAGNNSGAVGFFPLAEQQHRAGQLPLGGSILQPPAVVLQGCHRDVVRSVDCFDGSAAQQRLLCVTGGEDSQLALWTLDAATAAAAATVSSSRDSADSAGPRRQHQAGGAGAGGAAVSSARRSPY